MNGEYAPACRFVEYAGERGANPVVQPSVIGKLSNGVPSGPEPGADHRFQIAGGREHAALIGGPEAPPWGHRRNAASGRLNGSCGVFGKYAWSVAGMRSAFDSPAIFSTTPVGGVVHDDIGGREDAPESGFRWARDTVAVQDPPDQGVSSSRDPIFELPGNCRCWLG